MSQAFWCSPLLPSLPKPTPPASSPNTTDQDAACSFGSGRRFKHDLIAYLKAYGTRLESLHTKLQAYDFASVRGALVASVPSRTRPSRTGREQPLWGLPSLQRILRTVSTDSTRRAHVVTQCSSVASIGEKYLTGTFFPALSTSATPSTKEPRQSIIFPTPEEIRNSTLGYGSGGSIHMKIMKAPQQRQLAVSASQPKLVTLTAL